MKIIARGAEAIIYEDGDEIIKHREKKKYRLPEIDIPMRKSRTKREFTALSACSRAGLNVPKPIKVSAEGDKLYMEKIAGEQFDSAFSVEKTSDVGALLAAISKLGIVHGDLTTANILVKEGQVYLIDFGLSYFSKKDEDRATDLFLFKNALKSRHPDDAKKAYRLFIEAYEVAMGKEFKGIETHLKDIERRGRYHENG